MMDIRFRRKVKNVARRWNNMDARLKWGILFLVACVYPFLVSSQYYVHIMNLAFIYVVLSLGLNIVCGLAGLLDLGFIAFYAVGAYTYAILSIKLGLSFLEILPIACFTTALFGLLVGSAAFRLRGDYFAIVTMGYGEIIRILANNLTFLTNGPIGIAGIPRPSIFGFKFEDPFQYYFMALAFVAIAVFLTYRFQASRIGRALEAIREDEIAAVSMGVNLKNFKLISFILGAMLGGSIGVFFASYATFVSPESFSFMESVMVLAMVVIGGMGTIEGPVIGALTLVFLPEILRSVSEYRMLIFGALMVFMMIVMPKGFMGWIKPRRILKGAEEENSFVTRNR